MGNILSMYKVKITVIRKIEHKDLIEKYEKPIKNACSLVEGDTFISINSERPNGFCESAWGNLSPFVLELANGATDFFGGWMQKERTAMVSCNDGFRPVSFLLETIL